MKLTEFTELMMYSGRTIPQRGSHQEANVVYAPRTATKEYGRLLLSVRLRPCRAMRSYNSTSVSLEIFGPERENRYDSWRPIQ